MIEFTGNDRPYHLFVVIFSWFLYNRDKNAIVIELKLCEKHFVQEIYRYNIQGYRDIT